MNHGVQGPVGATVFSQSCSLNGAGLPQIIGSQWCASPVKMTISPRGYGAKDTAIHTAVPKRIISMRRIYIEG